MSKNVMDILQDTFLNYCIMYPSLRLDILIKYNHTARFFYFFFIPHSVYIFLKYLISNEIIAVTSTFNIKNIFFEF